MGSTSIDLELVLRLHLADDNANPLLKTKKRCSGHSDIALKSLYPLSFGNSLKRGTFYIASDYRPSGVVLYFSGERVNQDLAD
jgi:hypothetical protein